MLVGKVGDSTALLQFRKSFGLGSSHGAVSE
jgi:hypothetical protein